MDEEAISLEIAFVARFVWFPIQFEVMVETIDEKTSKHECELELP